MEISNTVYTTILDAQYISRPYPFALFSVCYRIVGGDLIP